MNKNRRENAGTHFSVYTADSGVGAVVASDAGLLEVFLPARNSVEEMKSQLVRLYPKASGENALTRNAAELLRQYFSGRHVDFDLSLDLEGCTEFRRDVYTAVFRIPYGNVRTYAEVAAEIGRPKASRGIGTAMAGNSLPIIIPCHRVIGADGKMTGYSAPGGTALKADLLRMEGVSFDDGGSKVKR